MTFATSALRRLTSTLRAARPGGKRVRDPKPRRGYYDGTEQPDLTPPNRYARGKKATPAPPPAAM